MYDRIYRQNARASNERGKACGKPRNALHLLKPRHQMRDICVTLRHYMHYICVTPRRQMRYICVDSPRHYICATFVSATRPGTACVTFVSTRPVEPVQSTTVNDRVRSCNALVTCVYYQVQREYRPRSVDQTRIHASLRGIWNANLRCSSGDFTVCAVFPLCVR